MTNIPSTSQLIPLEGLWFIFKDGDREIALHNSTLGQERIFVNGELVSRKRSLSTTSRHTFIFNDNAYEVVAIVSKISTSEMECSLIKDGICIGKFKTYYKRVLDIIKFPRKLFALILFGLLIGSASAFFASFFKIPLLFPLMTGMGIYMLIIGRIANKGNKMIIEEIDV